MGINLTSIEGQTPIDEDEKEGLLIPSISTREELDEFEQKNIEQAILWTLKRKFNCEEIFTEIFVRELHRRMYEGIWKWAGEFRRTNKNLGVDKYQISTSLRQLLENCNYWIENEMYEPVEIAIRFKHGIVSIHCFVNGNGRHSRLIADVIVSHIFGLPAFSWGSKNLVKQGESRSRYIKALKEADAGNFKPLIQFSRM